jgi:hypothetical protein
MDRRRFLAVTLVGLVSTGLKAAPSPPKYQALHARFACSLELSPAAKLGLDAVSLTFPKDSKRPVFEVVVCELGEEAFSAMQGAGQKPLDYARTTYLGQSGPLKQKGTRTFVQGPQPTEVDPESFPNKDYLEICWLERKQGAGLMLAFRVSPTFDKAEARKAIDTICASLEWKR